MPGSRHIIRALRSAARKGSLSACFVLGRLYDEGWGVSANPRVATRWYLQAAEGGLPEALYFVASAFHSGDGVVRDPKRAVAWYRKAAAAGDRGAEFALAVAVLQGEGVRRDEAKAVRLLGKISRYDSDAMDYLAFHYLERGRFSLAKRWATRAATRGHEFARGRLAEIEKARRAARTRSWRRQGGRASGGEGSNREVRRRDGSL
jgi:TPR repeat protein